MRFALWSGSLGPFRTPICFYFGPKTFGTFSVYFFMIEDSSRIMLWKKERKKEREMCGQCMVIIQITDTNTFLFTADENCVFFSDFRWFNFPPCCFDVEVYSRVSVPCHITGGCAYRCNRAHFWPHPATPEISHFPHLSDLLSFPQNIYHFPYI